jgi:hypothetical protein
MAKARKRTSRPPSKAAKKKPARAPRKVAHKPSASRKTARRGPKKAAPAVGARKAAKKAVAKKAVVKRAAVKKGAKVIKAKTVVKPKKVLTARKAAPPTPRPSRPPAARRPPATRKLPALDRERRTIREEEPMPGPPSSLDLNRNASAARSGRHEYDQRLRQHTSTGPAMTGGDVDADWEDAETVGDEAPGGDNPTPDQDVVEEIGEALGITYDDSEELLGGDELAERDRHRWELDPASREDEE